MKGRIDSGIDIEYKFGFEEGRGIGILADPTATVIYNAIQQLNVDHVIRQLIFRLTYYAVRRGVPLKYALKNACHYLFEHEYPEELLRYKVAIGCEKYYNKCISIWRELGLIHPRPIIERYLAVINSDAFRHFLLKLCPNVKYVDTLIREMKRRVYKVGYNGGLWSTIINILLEVDGELWGLISKRRLMHELGFIREALKGVGHERGN